VGPNGSPEIPTTWTPATLGVHNFACKPLIEMRFKAKLYPSLKSFPMVCRMPPAREEIEAIPNSHPLTDDLFLAITCV